ncbi:hypothetical protein N7490_000053, partial [Penicillium lividum]
PWPNRTLIYSLPIPFLRYTLFGIGASLPLLVTSNPEVIQRDVVVIGGGASGAYAAVRLRDDFNKSIALIEKQATLGGMVNTYIDDKTSAIYDYGVNSFLNTSKSMVFFARFNIPVTTNSTTSTATTQYFDFNNGKKVGFNAPSVATQIATIAKFLKVIEPWESMLRPGYWNFPKPKNIPADFLIPFGEFLTKHGVEKAAPLMYSSTGLGVGNMSEATTMFALQAFVSGGNQALYNAIEKDLGNDVFYSSTIFENSRANSGVLLTVRNHETGEITRIAARRLLIAIEPSESNMKPLDLSPSEWNTLSKFDFSNEFCGLVDNDAFNTSYLYSNLPSDAAPNHYLVFQDEPVVQSFEYSGLEHLFRVIIIGNKTTTAADAKSLAQDSFNTLLKSGCLSSSTESQDLSWAALSTHGPMHARVPVEDVKAGFYQDLYKLQGARSTWWTGGAFSVNFQTTLWEFDEGLFPKILEGL